MLSVKNEIQQHFEDILVEHDYFETDVFCNWWAIKKSV
jgi:hypothetical protein